MTARTAPLSELIDAIVDDGGGGTITLVTATRRLARDLRRRINNAHIERAHSVWPTADVLPWSSWLSRLWDNGASDDDPMLLAPIQALAVWETVIAADLQSDQPYVPVRTIANSARAARQLALEWEIDTRMHPDRDGPDADRFGLWHARFNTRLEREAWLDEPGATALLIDRLSAGDTRAVSGIAGTVGFVGFARFAPQHQRLRDALAGHCRLCDVQHQVTATSRYRTEFNDADSELHAAAAWARAAVEDAADKDTVRVGVVVNNLAAKRQHVRRIFSEHIDSGHDALDPDAVSGFHVGGGVPLSEQPMIHAALLALRWAVAELNVADVGALLRSPFFITNDDYDTRCVIDFRLRKLGAAAYRIKDLIALSAPHSAAASEWLDCLKQLSDKTLQGRHPPSEWAHRIDQVLRECGWPGGRTLNPAEQQTLKAWHQCLSQVTTLGLVVDQWRLSDALRHLALAASQQSAHSEAPDVALHVVDTNEAQGLTFSHLWITGVNDSGWPAARAPNPFIPFSRQRRAHHPNADPDAARQLAVDTLAGLCDSAASVVASFARRDEQAGLLPSPLLSDERFALQRVAADDVAVIKSDYEYRGRAHQLFQAKPVLAIVEDHRAPPLADGERHGGVDIFTRQSLCPFQAMTAHRLRAHPLEEPIAGIDARERGTLVHAVCDTLWQTLKTGRALRALSETARELIVNEVVDGGIAARRERAPYRYNEASVALERRRLRRLITALLERECERDAFTVIATEYQQQAEIGGLTINTRIDRVDQLDNGDVLIIDYKTGETAVSAWVSERPDEPQLPIYALTYDGDVRGIAFVELRDNGAAFKGVADYVMADGVKDVAATKAGYKDYADWAALRAHWQQTVDALGAAFINGDARVAPKNTSACRYCRFDPLCRIERQGDDMADDEDDDGVKGMTFTDERW